MSLMTTKPYRFYINDQQKNVQILAVIHIEQYLCRYCRLTIGDYERYIYHISQWISLPRLIIELLIITIVLFVAAY